ncbi:MAG: hypothetical protein J5486_04695 [Bacteroidaceae bacterium]|nr:hypothetical protein [Bacteroidaceae bacterium]
MKFYRLMMAVTAMFMTAAIASAQTDVTSDYLANPSFEDDAAACTEGIKVIENNDELRGWNVSSITGWTTTRPDKQLLITADCFTDNNFGKTAIADGTYALFQRNGWSNKASSISQTTKALPAGSYILRFKTKAFYANSATSSVAARIVAGTTAVGNVSISFDQGSAGCMASSDWNEQQVRFKVDATTPVTIELTITWVSGGSQLAIDDLRLISIPDDYVEPSVIGGRETDVASPTEGIISHEFVSEADMMADLLQMLANHTRYAKNIWFKCVATNSVNEECGYFKGNSAGQNNEDGVRTNADFSMICAFLWKYAQGKVTLPEGVTWTDIHDMALQSLVFGYSTHKANKLKVTSNNAYWGSVSTSDAVWESSLWAMSLAYSSYFLKDELTEAQKQYIYNMVKAECNYELNRSIPTGYNGDTKAEENGWEADILACALGLYPNDALAQSWFERLRLFAINSYSQADDATNYTIIDPSYDQTTVADLYKGQNLYDDYTLQNHNYFHTSYQNVVMQELGEAHLAMLLFQGASPKWATNALMHNQQHVMTDVLNRLALSDGELAMPNGNDWSMFLYDQITSYSTAACFLGDADALLLENMAYKYIKARQSTTSDGSWLLNSDIGPRRMGVEAHRVMMTYLMHLQASTAQLQPTSWADFCSRNQDAHVFRTQNIVRAASDDRFVVFSWSNGLNSYTGYIADTTPDRNKIICPYKANNTGNLLGWYNVSGKGTNASPTVSGIYDLHENAFTMNGRLNTNDATLENAFVLAATSGNAVIYMNDVRALQAATITGRRGGMLAISTDPFTREKRTLYHSSGRLQSDGRKLNEIATEWLNIDNSVGIVTLEGTGKMAFGERALSSSVEMSKLYPLYSADNEAVSAGQQVDRSTVIYYSKVDSATTARLQAQAMSLTSQLPDGWNGLICADPDDTRYLLLANFNGGSSNRATLKGITFEGLGAPVLAEETTITNDASTATIALDKDHSLLQPLTVFISGGTVIAKCFNRWDDSQISVRTAGNATQHITVTYKHNGQTVSKLLSVEPNRTMIVRYDNGDISMSTEGSDTVGLMMVDVTEQYLTNPSFENDLSWSTTGNITLNGVTYNPCYTQSETPVNSSFPQVLPVAGWTAETSLAPASKFALLYSMPYSFTQYCVSPSSIGNSTSIMAEPANDNEAGLRCLSVLNSWTIGSNAISQTVNLPAGNYMLEFDMRYACANVSRYLAPNIISTTGGNVNTSLCGIAFNNEEHYLMPTTADTWEPQVISFTLTEATDVTFRLGLSTTANQGAANQTRLYIDNLRLWSQQSTANAIEGANAKLSNYRFFDLSGRQIATPTQHGIYIIGNDKVAF